MMAQIRPLSPELAEVARTQLNEVEECIPQNILALRNWIKQHPHLTARTDDQFLVGFLRFCQHDLECAKKRMEYYYTYKSTTAMELFKVRSSVDDKILAICRAGICVTLPKPAGAAGPRIHFTRMANIDTTVHTVQDIFRFQMVRSEIEINTDDNWIISGVLEIVDFSKISFALVKQFEPGLFKKMAAFLEYGVPTNLRATHIVNASMEVQLIMTVVRALMKQRELLHVHSNLESLQDTIGKEYLPVEYGGSNGSLAEATVQFEQTLLEWEPYFNEDTKYFFDESRRKPLTKTCSNSDGSTTGILEYD